MRASTSYELSKLVNEKVSEVLFDKCKNLQNFIRDRIMENPTYIKARDVAQKMIDDNNGDWNDLNGIGSTIFMDLINYISKIKITYTNKRIMIIIFKKDDYVTLLTNILEIIHQEAIKNEIR